MYATGIGVHEVLAYTLIHVHVGGFWVGLLALVYVYVMCQVHLWGFCCSQTRFCGVGGPLAVTYMDMYLRN